MPQYFCEKCGRTMDETQFYTSHNLEKYPNGGKLKQCKKCITMHVDNWDPSTFIPILQEIDVPYIKEQWDQLLEKFGQDPTKITGATILGRYLSKMKLTQWNKYRFADTERLELEAKEKKAQSMRAAGYSGEEIEQQLSVDRTPPRPKFIEDGQATELVYEDAHDDMEDTLTDEDKTYLRIKWGKGYRPSEWIQLEQLYEDMMASYDIQGAGHIDTLKLVCKTSLKANQLIDMGDVEGFQKMSKVYDQLMKSGKFTAAQNKGESGEFIDSLGELVALCEKQKFIPRYYTDGPQDKVDRVLEDLQHYTNTLVTEEMNLGNLIEQSIKQIAEQMAKEDIVSEDDIDNEGDDDAFERSLFDFDESIIQTEDYEELFDQEEESSLDDVKYIESLLNGEDE